ncbi:MAG: ABC transporter ATP-binding protein [Thermodesulfobacteriota bacterium]
MYIIETKHLTKEFKGLLNRKRLVAVDDVSLRIDKGEIVGLLGVNGAGKTTLLKMICGLLLPTRGEVLINGRSLQHNRAEALERIGAVLEGSRNSLWSLTVKQNLTYFGHLKNTHGKPLRDRGDELLRFFELEKKKNEVVKNLSKGMKQKLAIILAFISDPELILLDEPTLGLDIHTAALVKKRIVDLARKQGKTIFLTTHQIEIVEEICDRVAIIHQGRLLAFEKTEILLGNMGQDHYIITFDSRPDISLLQNLPMVREIQPSPCAAKSPAAAVRLVLDRKNIFFEAMEALLSMDARILSIEKSDPKLEDVYIRMTGNN